jgi:hypothetical protein
MTRTVPRDPLELLRERLADDRRAGVPFTPEDFAQHAWLACRATRAHVWLWPIIETYPAWAAAYRRDGTAALAPSLLLDSAGRSASHAHPQR